MELKNCTLCPLSENLLAGCTPFKTYGSGDILLIATNPSEDEVLINSPCSAEYDFLKKIINVPFRYTFLTRCNGVAKTENKKVCIDNWLSQDIKKSKIVFGLGIEVCYHLIPINRKVKIQEIIGEEFTSFDTKFIPTYSANFVMNRNKTILEKFKKVFNEWN
jgi:hypothetical protein